MMHDSPFEDLDPPNILLCLPDTSLEDTEGCIRTLASGKPEGLP